MQTQIFTSIFYADSNIHLNFIFRLKYSPKFSMFTQIFTSVYVVLSKFI